jgi:hypothetical protein
MKKQSYVPTSLGQFLNENSNRSITLTRKYGNKQPVVVGSRAPLRNTVLGFVSENQKVSRVQLKRFIAGLNETSKNPAAAANMWLKRNNQFFESKVENGQTIYSLSKLGTKLVSTLTPATSEISEGKKKKKEGVKAVKKTDKNDISEEDEDDDVNESREERIQKIVEQIRAKRSKALLEEENTEMVKEDDEEDDEAAEDDDKDDEDAEEAPAEDDEDDEEAPAEDDVDDLDVDAEADDAKVEITEFIITVDDIPGAIAELQELGVEAEEVAAGEEGIDVGDEDLGGEEDLDLGIGDDMVDDFDLGGDLGELGGEGEEDMDMESEPIEDVEESVTGQENFQKKMTKEHGRVTPNLTEEEDDLEMEDLDSFEDEGGEEDFAPAAKEGGDDDFDLGGEEDLDLGGEEDLAVPAEGGESQIRVSAENWEVLKGWLEGKGVDIDDMFDGDIETDGEGIEDEISFDGLEDIAGEAPKKDAEDDDKDDDDDDESEDDDDDTEEKDDKKDFTPGKKGVNPFPKKGEVKESLTENEFMSYQNPRDTLPEGLEVNPNNVRAILGDEPMFFGGLERQHPEILGMDTIDVNDQTDQNAFFEFEETILQDTGMRFDIVKDGSDGKVHYNTMDQLGYVTVYGGPGGQDYNMFFFGYE